MTITALAGTVAAGLLVTQAPLLSAVGGDDYGKREEDTPSFVLVDDEDATGKDKGTGTPSRATRDTSRADVTRNSRVSRVSREDRSNDRAPVRRPAAPADDSVDRDTRSAGSRRVAPTPADVSRDWSTLRRTTAPPTTPTADVTG